MGKLRLRPAAALPAGAINVDALGNVYVADASERIKVFSRLGRHIRTWAVGDAPGQVEDVEGLTVDPLGNVYVADFYNNRVQKFTPTGHLLARWERRGTTGGTFRFPSDVAIGGNGQIYVTDLENHRVQRFQPRPQLGGAALGDSYAAGVGLGRVTDGCDRDRGAYGPHAGRQLAASRFDVHLVHLACSGDTATGVRSTQLNRVDVQDNVVTLTVGGNDIGFADKVAGCWVDGCGEDTFRLLADRVGGSRPGIRSMSVF